MKLEHPLSIEGRYYVVTSMDRTTTNGKNVKHILSLLEEAYKNGYRNYSICKRSDFKWASRRNRDKTHNIDRVGVIQHCNYCNYYVFLEVWKWKNIYK